MKKKSLYCALLLLMGGLMVGCEHISTIEKHIVNSSSHDAIIVYEGGGGEFESDSVSVPAGSTVNFLTWDEIGTKDAPDCLENLTSVRLLLPDSLSLLKNPETESNWSSTTVKVSRGEYTHTCTFVLTDADVQ